MMEALPPAPGELMERADAETRSAALARECLQMFWRFAQRHHVTPDEARILILNTGVRL